MLTDAGAGPRATCSDVSLVSLAGGASRRATAEAARNYIGQVVRGAQGGWALKPFETTLAAPRAVPLKVRGR